MKTTLVSLLLVPIFVQAQSSDSGVSEATYEAVIGELESVALVGATVALLGERGVVPETTFDLTGSREADLTGFRRFPLSLIDVSSDGETVLVEYTPLPRPYVREDVRFEVSVAPRPGEPGKYDVAHTLRKHEAPTDGGDALFRIASMGRIASISLPARCVQTHQSSRPASRIQPSMMRFPS